MRLNGQATAIFGKIYYKFLKILNKNE